MRIILFTEQSSLPSMKQAKLLKDVLKNIIGLPKAIKNGLTILDKNQKQNIAAHYKVIKAPHIIFTDNKRVLLEVVGSKGEKELGKLIREAYAKYQRYNPKNEEKVEDEE